ncbi:hypothetical protein HPB50_013002 [Hyalomma asiaticum]|uniref:Uncharacterized protein n=1 Tax=Hyalomma asiaticum TaxID=266040 RepID=A0ACB7SB28_HYAAI|nr:hypothetical protein HPB50_013002 [Hyalomma asiaticum]
MPKTCPLGATVAAAAQRPLSVLALQRALRHTDRFHHAPDDGPLLCRLGSLPEPQHGRPRQLYVEHVEEHPETVPSPPPHKTPLKVHVTIGRASEHGTQCSCTAASGSRQILRETRSKTANLHQWLLAALSVRRGGLHISGCGQFQTVPFTVPREFHSSPAGRTSPSSRYSC